MPTLLPDTPVKTREIAVLGNPNSGKTTIFNALTGLRHKTANYPGVTVEKKIGWMTLEGKKEKVTVLDLPGTYSLSPHSLDEEVTHDVLLGVQAGTPAPDLIILVLDLSNLERNLYLASQIMELGIPTIWVLNMWDLAKQRGLSVDMDALQRQAGVPCVPTIGNKGFGIKDLKTTIAQECSRASLRPASGFGKLQLPEPVVQELRGIGTLLRKVIRDRETALPGEALRLLADTGSRSPAFDKQEIVLELRQTVAGARQRLQAHGVSWKGLEAQRRYAQIEMLCKDVLHQQPTQRRSLSDRLDTVLTHRVWGLAIFVGLMGMIFQSIFSWAQVPMDLIAASIQWLGAGMTRILPQGQLQSLVVDGMIAGVGNVIVFLPQIFLLFFFIALFEDVGYMARAAFVLDRLMKKVGLNGKAFLPLLSSFACAIPGIMATRTIQDKNERLATTLVAPLMSCSARLPVYALMIGAFIPAVSLWGIFNLKGVTLLSLYLLSIVAGLGMASLFRKTFLKGTRTPGGFELPPYRLPNIKTVVLTMWDRGKEFLRRAGSIIFTISIVLWFLVSYPKGSPSDLAQFDLMRQEAQATLNDATLQSRLTEIDHEVSGNQLRNSFAGRSGRLIEPLIRPLGFDWKIGIGLIGSFAAREVLVSTLAIVYNVGGDANESSVDLIKTLQSEVSPETGRPLYTPLVAITLMVFFVLACQCMSTLAIVRRETGGWGWPIFMFSYMTGLAWLASFAVYQGGRLLGLG